MPGLNVKQRAEAVGTLRYVNVFLMETLAAWIPTTPEMEAKVLFGRHVWRVAQKADALGLRTRELRAPLHHSVAPSPGCMRALKTGAALEKSEERVAGYHELLLGLLGSAYATYLARTDRIIDEPTVIILEGAQRDIEVMRAEAERLLAEFPGLRIGSSSGLDPLRRSLAGAQILSDELIGERRAAATG